MAVRAPTGHIEGQLLYSRMQPKEQWKWKAAMKGCLFSGPFRNLPVLRSVSIYTALKGPEALSASNLEVKGFEESPILRLAEILSSPHCKQRTYDLGPNRSPRKPNTPTMMDFQSAAAFRISQTQRPMAKPPKQPCLRTNPGPFPGAGRRVPQQPQEWHCKVVLRTTAMFQVPSHGPLTSLNL